MRPPQIQHCPRVVRFGRCSPTHPSLGVHRGAESAAAAAAATVASSCASTANLIVAFLRVNHGFLTMPGLWCDSGRRFAEPETQSHARMVSREIPNHYVEQCSAGSCCQCVTALPTCWHRGFPPQHASQKQKRQGKVIFIHSCLSEARMTPCVVFNRRSIATHFC